MSIYSDTKCVPCMSMDLYTTFLPGHITMTTKNSPPELRAKNSGNKLIDSVGESLESTYASSLIQNTSE